MHKGMKLGDYGSKEKRRKGLKGVDPCRIKSDRNKLITNLI